MATSKRILRKDGKALRKSGACTPLAGSVLESRGEQKRKAAKRKPSRRKATRKASRRG